MKVSLLYTLIKILVSESTFKVLYVRKEIEKKPKAAHDALKFKNATKIDLKTVTSKVKPGMMTCDDKAMTQAMRQAVRVQFRDFKKLEE